jgi:anaerobic dimethyl sulfoxide reductase subunit A
MSSNGKDEGLVNKNVSRRSVLKWSGALAAAGIVGVGLGIGGDILLRPSTTTTATKTATATATTTVSKTGSATATTTTTVTVPPTTLSYMPPLSPEVQTIVDNFVSSQKALHTGETLSYAAPGEWPDNGTFASTGLVKIRTKNGVITAIEPDDTVNPGVTIEDAVVPWTDIMAQNFQGRAPARIYGYRGFLYHPDRLGYPMQRVGGTHGYPGGQFVRITWSQAISTIAGWMQQTKAKYGNYSINGGTGYDIGSWFGCEVDGWGCDSSEIRGFAYRFVYGTGYGVGCGMTQPEEMTDMFNSKLILMFGVCDVTEDSFAPFGYWLRLAREKGIPIISVDPRYTETNQSLCDQWIPIRMNTDTALALAIANVMFTQNLVNTDYVNKFVEPTGFAKWQAYVLGQTAGPDGAINRTPEWAAPITGIPADTITALAQLFASSNPTYLICGNAISNKQPYGENAARIFCYLQAMAGYTGVTGGTETNILGNVVEYGIPVPAPNIGMTPGTFYNPISPEGPGIYQGWRFASVVLDAPKVGVSLTQQQYENQNGMLPGNPLPNIHMAFEGGLASPAQQRPDVNLSYQAYNQLDYIVSVASHASDPVATCGDIILPIAVWVENDPAFFQIENKFIYQQRLSTPPGDAKTQNWIDTQLANALGFGSQFSSVLSAVPMTETWPDTAWDAAWESINQTAYTTWASGKQPSGDPISDLNPPSWSDFKANPVFTFPIGPLEHPPIVAFADQIQNGQPFPNDVYRNSGKIEFYSNWLATTDMTTTWYGGPIAPMAEWVPMWDSYWQMSEIAQYPLLVTTAHARHRLHNWVDANPLLGDVTNNLESPSTTGDMYQARVYIPTIDAANRGIVDGDLVKVFNDAGSTILTAVVVPWLIPGHIHLPEGRWGNFVNGTDVRGNANTITYADRWDYAGSFPQTTIAQVEKVA